MLNLLKDLAFGGVELNSLKSEQKELARILINEKIASLHEHKIYLNNGFIFGRLMTNSKGAGFLKAPSNAKFASDQDIKISANDLNSARKNDLVIAKLTGYKRGREHAKIVLVCERALNSGVVELVRIKGVYFGKCFRTGLCMQLNASQKSLAALPRRAVLAVEYGEKNEITEVLGVLDDPRIDEKISLYIFNKREEFDEACLNQARANAGVLDASFYPQRLDLRHLPFCTIDPVHAKDFDDAIFYDEKERTLWVMIADVSEYVSIFSALDKEALKRGFSVYFPHKCVPMLPYELSEHACSLNPNEDKLAFGFCLKYDELGELKSATLHEAIICSKRRFNYDEIDLILESAQDLGEFSFIHALNKFTQNKRKKRLKQGYDFHTAELRLELENQLISRTYFEHSTISHQLIEECMLEANKAAAAMLGEKGIFRNHTSPNLTKISQMFNELELMGLKFKQGKSLHETVCNAQEMADEMGIREEIDKIIIRSFKKADYGASNQGHYALGFEKYSHFTSPIRRYSDLILHRLLKAILAADERQFAFCASNLEERCAHISSLEKDAEKVARDFNDRKFARWALEHIGQEFSACVLAGDDALIARLESGAMGARVFLANCKASAFSKIKVQISDADLHSGMIYARFIAYAEPGDV